jgi:transcriptional regulator with XRE-family HTH domain
MKLGEAIGKERKAQGFSLRDLEAISGIAYTLISKIERGRVAEPGFRVVSRLAKALRIGLDSLAKLERAPEAHNQKRDVAKVGRAG